MTTQTRTWVNYQKLRERLDFETVLAEYGVQTTLRGDQITAFCPFPEHEDSKSKSFSASISRSIFQCFGCHAKGNILEFCVRMEGFDPTDAKQFREGALKVQERMGGVNTKTATAKRDELGEGKPKPVEVEESTSDDAPEDGAKRVINAPLDFELKSIDVDHPYLKERGLTPETIQYFGLGVASRGLMKNRAVIPLHDFEGTLIGYAGRLVDDNLIDDDNPKYLLPGKRTVKGIEHQFWKSEFVFNGHRQGENSPDLVVVEGFFQAMWLHQCGFPRVVALMGSSLSERQATLLCRLTSGDGRIFILPDGDPAGDKMAESVMQRIARDRLVRHLRLPAGNDADTIEPESLERLLEGVGL